MGGVGIGLLISGTGNRCALHRAIWEFTYQVVERYCPRSRYDDVHQYLDHWLEFGVTDDNWGVQADELQWSFGDYAGIAERSAELWAHWVTVAVAAEWDSVCTLAAEHGLRIEQRRFDLSQALATDGSAVELRGKLWWASETALTGDDDRLWPTGLSTEERSKWRRALARCQCPLCCSLRPCVAA